MPLNAPVEFFLAEKKYQDAKTDSERLVALEEMLSACPKHKGAENKLKEIKNRITKLREKIEKSKTKSRRGGEFVRKQGIQIVLIGPPNSGKTKLFTLLTGLSGKSTDVPFETSKITPGIALLNDVKFQILDTPSISEKNKEKLVGLAKSADLAIAMGDFDTGIKCIRLSGSESASEIIEKIFSALNIIRVYTKPPWGEVSKEAVPLKSGSTVLDLAKKINKDLARRIKFARVWGSSKFLGQHVSSDYILRDGDIVEINVQNQKS